MASTSHTKSLADWFRQHQGYLHPNIRILQDDNSGVHYRAIAPIEPQGTLASAPHTISLSYLNALVDDEFPVFKQQRRRFKVEAIGFFYLMAQWVNRDRSFWKPYLDSLPPPEHDFSQPLFFENTDDVAWLEGTDVWHTVLARKEVYREYYETGVAVLKRAGIDVQPYTWHLFKWAATIFTSRSFSSRALRSAESKYWTTYKFTSDGQRKTVLLDMSHTLAEDLDFPVLFPGLDAANHNHEARVDWAFDPGSFSISTVDGVASGVEVFNNYGPKGNGELLIGYGFCIPPNPYDTVALTLKAPPEALQSEMKDIHPGYFTASGDWSPEWATFRLQRLPPVLSDPSQVFSHIPEPLLELLLYLLRHERGLPFDFIAELASYLNSDGSPYLPHVARMMVQSLVPKLTKMDAASLPTRTQNNKQLQASIYRQGQLEIMQTLIAALKTYTRSLLWSPSSQTATMPMLPCFIRLEHFIASLTASNQLESAFLDGIEASANTRDVEQLRLAGWEEDMWVLLLSYLFLKPRNSGGWVQSIWPEYIRRPGKDLGPDADDGQAQATDLMEIVQTASSVCPDSAWADQRWSAAYVTSVGARFLQYDSFMMMCPGVDGNEEARLCLYLHPHSS